MFDYVLCLRQLCQCSDSVNPVVRLYIMVGAEKFAKSDEGNYVMFHFKMCRKASVCKITLNDGDLYDMEFLKRVKTFPGAYTFDKVHVVYDVFNDCMKSVFENYTGLYLSL